MNRTGKKPYFIHIRASVLSNKMSMLRNISATGGATLLVDESVEGWTTVRFSIVNDKDNYCKATGRTIITGRKGTHKNEIGIPTCNRTDDILVDIMDTISYVDNINYRNRDRNEDILFKLYETIFYRHEEI